MDKVNMEKFLTQCAVPVKKKDDRIYDCVWRAHRDVLAGRFYLLKYQNFSHDMVDNLCEVIKNYKKRKNLLTSNMLIQKLKGKYETVEFGAIQKLANMSLKYLLILKEYESLDIKIDEKNCDCPLDSYILKKIGHREINWTSINPKEYKEMQNIIKEYPESKNGNIYFDFLHWNQLG